MAFPYGVNTVMNSVSIALDPYYSFTCLLFPISGGGGGSELTLASYLYRSANEGRLNG